MGSNKVGTIRVAPAKPYGRDGFVVEQLRYVSGSDAPEWCVPGWVEDLWGQSGFFATEREARDFLAITEA